MNPDVGTDRSRWMAGLKAEGLNMRRSSTPPIRNDSDILRIHLGSVAQLFVHGTFLFVTYHAQRIFLY